MLGNIIIIALFSAAVAACYYSIKSRSGSSMVMAMLFCLPYILTVISLNMSLIFFPMTPKVHGKIIDAETKKPLAGINIKVGWDASTSTVGGGSRGYYKIYKTKTDKDGLFVVPMGVKALNVEIPPAVPLFKREFSGVFLAAYSDKYDYKILRHDLTDTKQLELSMKPIKTDIEYLDNIINYWNSLGYLHRDIGQHILDSNEKMWLKQSYYEFEKRFPDSTKDKDYLFKLSDMYDWAKDPEAVYVLKKLITKYPDNVNVESAKRLLEAQKYTNFGKPGGGK